MRFRLIYLSIALIKTISACSQLDSYIHKIPDQYAKEGFYKFITKTDSSKNLYLLSETDHRFSRLVELKTGLLEELNRKKDVEKIFYENSAENDMLLKKYYTSNFSLSVFPDSLVRKYNAVISNDTSQLAHSWYRDLLQTAVSNHFLNKLQGIDIGTQTIFLGLWNLCIYTKQENLLNDPVINHFCDSIMDNYKVEYSNILESPDSDGEFNLKKDRIDSFLLAVDKSINDGQLLSTWKSLFAPYFKVHANRTLSFPLALGHARQLTSREFAQKNSFRDSVIYGNFTQSLPVTWNNIVISFSSLHLMDTRKSDLFNDVIDSSSNTFGKYLHTSFRPFLRRIAFVCYYVNTKSTEYNNQHEKESLEYSLAKQYDMAYVDLYSYAHSEGEKKPFFMRPTFFNYRKLNWETIFDGIVFIKDCGCRK